MKHFLKSMFWGLIISGIVYICINVAQKLLDNEPSKVTTAIAGVFISFGIIGLFSLKDWKEPAQCENQSVWDSLAILAEINQLHNKTRELQSQLESLAKDCVKPCKEGVCANECAKVSVCICKDGEVDMTAKLLEYVNYAQAVLDKKAKDDEIAEIAAKCNLLDDAPADKPKRTRKEKPTETV